MTFLEKDSLFPTPNTLRYLPGLLQIPSFPVNIPLSLIPILRFPLVTSPPILMGHVHPGPTLAMAHQKHLGHETSQTGSLPQCHFFSPNAHFSGLLVGLSSPATHSWPNPHLAPRQFSSVTVDSKKTHFNFIPDSKFLKRNFARKLGEK